MRKHQQKQILELLGTIKRAQEAKLYADCQESAIVIGEFIEEIEGEGTQTVTSLEEYCELLYKASIGEAGKKALAKGLLQVENNVKNELKPNRYEMVFLSYKASMSDCIESIYMAAKDDLNCDVYWIPIPYYEYNQNGTPGTMHFDGPENYKQNIECTDYRDYDIEERHPDVVVTFAPYDSLGHMTTVHKDYYFQRMRNLTDLLVYVPYFVTSESIKEPFTKCPGVMFSHLVVVQSEAVRRSYIRDYLELEKIGYSRDIYGAPEEKIVALGSPKFDAVINAIREDFSLPEQWKTLIKNKKVILYNTSVNPILNYKEQYLIKLKYVMDTFRDRDDVVLWWRPHPLSKNAYNTMNPGLAGQYKRIVEEYKQAGYGIYDDTSDLHRAISWTDAYYGDISSLILLYQFTGKPIMIGDQKVPDYTLPFEPTCIYITKDRFLFTIRKLNALISMDRSTWIPELTGSFPNESDYTDKYNNTLYRDPVEAGDDLFFPPFLANEIAIYSPQTGAFEKVKYKDDINNEILTIDFLGAVVYGENVYFTPFEYPAIVRLNTKTMQISNYTDWIEPVKKLTGNEQRLFIGRPSIAGSSMWVSIFDSNAVMEFDMDTGKHTIYEIGKKEYRYNRALFDGKYFWLSPLYDTKTPVVKWSPETGVIKEFPEIHTDSDTYMYLPCIACNGYIWLLPVVGEHAYKIDVSTDTLSIASEFESGPAKIKTGNTAYKYTLAQPHGNCIYAFYAPTETLIEYDCIKKERREKVIEYTPETTEKLNRLLNNAFIRSTENLESISDSYYYESAYTRLGNFISFISSESNDSKAALLNRRKDIAATLTNNADGTAGKRIYDYIKKLIQG